MFALHETTQRRVCRVSFLVLCVVPTLLTLVGIAYCNRPWRQADWQRTLAGSLHVRAELEDISRPRPGETLLSNLRLADLRTNATLGSIGSLNLQQESGRLVLRADRLELHADQLGDLVTAFSTWLATSDDQPFELQVDELTIVGPSLLAIQLKGLTVRNELIDSQSEQFTLVAYDLAGKAIQVNLENSGAKINLKLDTSQAPLPAWLLGKLVPGIAGCGEATFLGIVAAASEDGNMRGKLQGTFARVDLQRWIGSSSPHRLQGVANLDLEYLTWSEGRLETSKGKVTAGRGMVSSSLLHNARVLCGCVLGEAWQSAASSEQKDPVDFESLALRFQMNSSGVAFAGQGADGALLMAKGQPVLLPPQRQIIPVGMLVRLFDSLEQPGWIPATRRAHSVAEQLPLPAEQARMPENPRK